MADVDDAVGMASRSLGMFGSEVKGATNSVVGLAGNLLSGSMKLSDYSKALDTNTKLFGKLGKVINALTMFAENSLAEYQSLTGIGASFGKQMTEIKIAAAELGMTVEDMTKLFKDNAEGLSALGGTTDSAISAFRNFSSSVLSSEAGTSLRRLGYTVEEINSNLLTYAEIAEQDNQLDRSAGRDRNASALEFAKELDALSKLTGKQRDQLADEMREARRQGDVQAYLTGQSAEASESLTKGLTEISTTMGPQYAELFKDLLIRGAPTTDETRNAFVALGDSADEFQAQVDAFKGGVNSGDFSNFDNAMMETQASFTDYLNTEEARQIGMLGGLTDISAAQGQLREDSYTFANRLQAAGDAAESTLQSLKNITAEIERQQEIQVSSEDTRNLIDETIRLNEATRDMVLATQQTALKKLEEMGISALQKVQDVMPSVQDITSQLGVAVDNLFKAADASDRLYGGNGAFNFESPATIDAQDVTVNDLAGTEIATLTEQQEMANQIEESRVDSQERIETAQDKLEAASSDLADLQAQAADLTAQGFTQQEGAIKQTQEKINATQSQIEQVKRELLQAQAENHTATKLAMMKASQAGGRKFSGGFAEGGSIDPGEFGVVGERGPEIVNGPGSVLSTDNTGNLMSLMKGLRATIDSTTTTNAPANEENTISNSITERMISTLETRLDKQSSILERLLEVETVSQLTGKKQYRATRGLGGNLLKGINT